MHELSMGINVNSIWVSIAIEQSEGPHVIMGKATCKRYAPFKIVPSKIVNFQVPFPPVNTSVVFKILSLLEPILLSASCFFSPESFSFG